MNYPRGKKRSLIGLVILAALGVLLFGFYADLRPQKHGALHQISVPRLAPPVLNAYVSQPVALSANIQKAAFHGTQSCVIAFINGEHYNKLAIISSGGIAGMGGWLVDKKTRTVPRNAWIILASAKYGATFQAAIKLHEKRPDVREALGGAAGYTNAGFIVDVYTKSLPIDIYHVYIVFESDGVYYTCDNGRHLRIVGNIVQGLGESK